MKEHEELIREAAQMLDSLGTPDCRIAASILRGVLLLPMAEQVRIVAIGNGVFTRLHDVIHQADTLRELVELPVCKN